MDQGIGDKVVDNECGKPVFPDHPEWGEILCNREAGHSGTHARFEVPARGATYDPGSE